MDLWSDLARISLYSDDQRRNLLLGLLCGGLFSIFLKKIYSILGISFTGNGHSPIVK